MNWYFSFVSELVKNDRLFFAPLYLKSMPLFLYNSDLYTSGHEDEDENKCVRACARAVRLEIRREEKWIDKSEDNPS